MEDIASLTMLIHVGAEESSKSAMYVLAPLLRPLITCRRCNIDSFDLVEDKAVVRNRKNEK